MVIHSQRGSRSYWIFGICKKRINGLLSLSRNISLPVMMFSDVEQRFLSMYWWQLQSTGSVYSATENRTEQLNWNMDVKFKSLSQGCAFCCIIYLLSGSLPEVDMWLLFIESRCRAARRGKLRWLRWMRATLSVFFIVNRNSYRYNWAVKIHVLLLQPIERLLGEFWRVRLKIKSAAFWIFWWSVVVDCH